MFIAASIDAFLTAGFMPLVSVAIILISGVALIRLRHARLSANMKKGMMAGATLILVGALVLGTVTLAHGGYIQNQAKAGPVGIVYPNPIIAENKHPGTTAWQVTNPSYGGEIQAYTWEDSINVGGTVHLYVSTLSPEQYDLKIFRLGYYQGKGGRFLAEVDNLPSTSQGYAGYDSAHPTNCPTCVTAAQDANGVNTHLVEADWNLSYTYTFTPSWLSGMYELQLTEHNGGKQWFLPLIVRDDASRSDILMNYALFTEEAYNAWGGTSLYKNYSADGATYPRAAAVSLNRPVTTLGPSSTDYVGKTYPMARFLEQYGYNVTYSTDVSISEGYSKLTNHKVFVNPGHDEYADAPLVQAIAQARTNGVNLAFFAGNNLYWQVRLDVDTTANHDPNRTIICYKVDAVYPSDPITPTNPALTTTTWRAAPVNRPEDAILDLMYDNTSPHTGAMLESNGKHVLQSMTVVNTNSWVFSNTGLKSGDQIPDVLGYELDWTHQSADITPSDTVTYIQASPVQNIDGTAMTAYSVIVQLADGKWLFNAGDVYWDLQLSDFDTSAMNNLQHPLHPSPPLIQITRNILTAMITGTTPVNGGSPTGTPVRIPPAGNHG